MLVFFHLFGICDSSKIYNRQIEHFIFLSTNFPYFFSFLEKENWVSFSFCLRFIVEWKEIVEEEKVFFENFNYLNFMLLGSPRKDKSENKK